MEKELNVLDLGCGEGRNALYLVQIGLKTTASDISKSGIEKLNTYAEKLKLKIDSSVCDMCNFEFKKKYDLIVCLGCLHLIYQNEWKELIKK